MAAGVASELDELLAQLDQKGSMDWRYLASQFPLTAEEVRFLGAQPSPARALMDALRTKGVQLQEIAETCRRSGLKSAGSVIETYSQRVDARGGSTHERADAKDVACQEWPAVEKVYMRSVPYESLCQATNNFSNKDRSQGGYMVGKGGFGDVFYVKIAVKGKPKLECAVKRLNRDCFDSEMKKQFEAEVKTMKAFTHPHLMPLYGVSQDGPHLCIVYPYMSGGSLKAAIANEKKLVPAIRLCILRDIASALDYLHTKRETPLVHRDVKSDNILLDDRNVAKLSDFGIVRVLSTAGKGFTKTAAIGTEKYMAPEILRGTVSPKGDVFALGVVLLELLVNQTIFRRESVAELGNGTLTAKSIEDLDLGWTEGQAKELLSLADIMTDLRFSRRPTAKEVHDTLLQISRGEK